MPTQAERSAATREKAIAATIDCLVERGYAGATIAAVAERAGISRGALSHQYPDKQRLVVETIEAITFRLTEQLQAEFEAVPVGRRRLERGLDEAWAIFTGPVFAAALEVYVAARTDPVLAPRIAELISLVEDRLREMVCAMVTEERPSAELVQRADVLVNTLRGLGLLWVTGAPRAPIEKTWRRVRRDALSALAEPGGSGSR